MLASLELRGHYDARIVLDWIRGRRIDGLIVPKSSRRERPLLAGRGRDARFPPCSLPRMTSLNHVAAMRGRQPDGWARRSRAISSTSVIRAIAFAGGPRYSIDSPPSAARPARKSCGGAASPSNAEVDRLLRQLRGRGRRALRAASARAQAGSDGHRVRQRRARHRVHARGAAARHPHAAGPVDRRVRQYPGGAMVWPGLTTVAQPMRDMGRDACRYLFESAPPRRLPERRIPDGAHHARKHRAASAWR